MSRAESRDDLAQVVSVYAQSSAPVYSGISFAVSEDDDDDLSSNDAAVYSPKSAGRSGRGTERSGDRSMGDGTSDSNSQQQLQQQVPLSPSSSRSVDLLSDTSNPRSERVMFPECMLDSATLKQISKCLSAGPARGEFIAPSHVIAIFSDSAPSSNHAVAHADVNRDSDDEVDDEGVKTMDGCVEVGTINSSKNNVTDETPLTSQATPPGKGKALLKSMMVKLSKSVVKLRGSQTECMAQLTFNATTSNGSISIRALQPPPPSSSSGPAAYESSQFRLSASDSALSNGSSPAAAPQPTGSSEVLFERPLCDIVDVRCVDVGRKDAVSFRRLAKDYELASALELSTSSSLRASMRRRGQSTAAAAAHDHQHQHQSSSFSSGGGAEGCNGGDHGDRRVGSLSRAASLRGAAVLRGELSAYLPPYFCCGSIGLLVVFAPVRISSAELYKTIRPREHFSTVSLRFTTSHERDRWALVVENLCFQRLLARLHRNPPSLAQQVQRYAKLNAELYTKRPSPVVVNSFKQLFLSGLENDKPGGGTIDADGKSVLRDPSKVPDGGVIGINFNDGAVVKYRRVSVSEKRQVLVIEASDFKSRLRMVPRHELALDQLTVVADDETWGNELHLYRTRKDALGPGLDEVHKIVLVARSFPRRLLWIAWFEFVLRTKCRYLQQEKDARERALEELKALDAAGGDDPERSGVVAFTSTRRSRRGSRKEGSSAPLSFLGGTRFLESSAESSSPEPSLLNSPKDEDLPVSLTLPAAVADGDTDEFVASSRHPLVTVVDELDDGMNNGGQEEEEGNEGLGLQSKQLGTQDEAQSAEPSSGDRNGLQAGADPKERRDDQGTEESEVDGESWLRREREIEEHQKQPQPSGPCISSHEVLREGTEKRTTPLLEAKLGTDESPRVDAAPDVSNQNEDQKQERQAPPAATVSVVALTAVPSCSTVTFDCSETAQQLRDTENLSANRHPDDVRNERPSSDGRKMSTGTTSRCNANDDIVSPGGNQGGELGGGGNKQMPSRNAAVVTTTHIVVTKAGARENQRRTIASRPTTLERQQASDGEPTGAAVTALSRLVTTSARVPHPATRTASSVVDAAVQTATPVLLVSAASQAEPAISQPSGSANLAPPPPPPQQPPATTTIAPIEFAPPLMLFCDWALVHHSSLLQSSPGSTCPWPGSSGWSGTGRWPPGLQCPAGFQTGGPQYCRVLLLDSPGGHYRDAAVVQAASALGVDVRLDLVLLASDIRRVRVLRDPTTRRLTCEVSLDAAATPSRQQQLFARAVGRYASASTPPSSRPIGCRHTSACGDTSMPMSSGRVNETPTTVTVGDARDLSQLLGEPLCLLWPTTDLLERFVRAVRPFV